MSVVIEHTDEFALWYRGLPESEQEDVTASVELLSELGVRLPFPHSSGIRGSRHQHLRELRIQSHGQPLRIFYAFDPRRQIILLIGGNKTGNNRFYDIMIPMAEDLYDVYLTELRQEGLLS